MRSTRRSDHAAAGTGAVGADDVGADDRAGGAAGAFLSPHVSSRRVPMNLLTDTLPGAPRTQPHRAPRAPRAPARSRTPFAEIGPVPHRDRFGSGPTTSEDALCRQDGRASRGAPPQSGSAGPRECRNDGCCTFAHGPRQRKPRNHAEKRFQRQPGPGSHVRRPPSTHMGARQPSTSINGKTHDSAKSPPSPREGPALPCATPGRTGEDRPHPGTAPAPSTTATPPTGRLNRSRCGTRPISAGGTSDSRDASGRSTPYRVDCCELRIDAHPCPSYAV